MSHDPGPPSTSASSSSSSFTSSRPARSTPATSTSSADLAKRPASPSSVVSPTARLLHISTPRSTCAPALPDHDVDRGMPPPRARKAAVVAAASAAAMVGDSSPSVASDANDTDDAEPSSSVPAKRARKLPSSKSGSAGGRQLSREQARKANHSIIERRRREKMNAALDDLRRMVPGLGDDGGKSGEFKLEVLERTVVHMRELKDRIAELEAGANPAAAAPPRPSRTPPSPSLSREDTPGGGPRSLNHRTAEPRRPVHDASPNAASLPTLPSFGRISPSATPMASLAAAQRMPTRPSPPPAAPNPTLFLPFPTPSPTSPFCPPAPAANATEPSPFMAPLQSYSLFNGALGALDPPAAPEAAGTRARDVGPEEAANLLLAFSSPDTLRPAQPPVSRRGTMSLDGEFSLDAGVVEVQAVKRERVANPVSVSARDILNI